MKTLQCKLSLALIALLTTFTVNAKGFQICLNSDPEGAAVYLNGVMVASSTPAVIEVEKKVATKVMIFKFEKEGYESRSYTVSYTKNQLKLNPVIYGKLKKSKDTRGGETTLTDNQMEQRVDRNNSGVTDIEKTIIRWYFDSEPRGARIYYRVISNVPAEVKNSNETYLTTTPLEETRSFGIPGLTYANSRNVTIEVKVSKRGYEDQVKRFNVRQALDQQEISGFFDLVPKEPKEPRNEE